MAKSSKQERIKRLEKHLQLENPILAGVVTSFQKLDRIARSLGLMDLDDSYATQVSWWPVISVLGTFSAGKSTFLNQYAGQELQRTGNQAVDDKFTVICYGAGESSSALPGLALDSDPRFPFYQISRDIEKVAVGEGRRVDSYLQLKTCRSEALQGKIFIDSPGFDADQQRNSTLLIIDHIIDLSDLVLVFFDSRHPEPGAMADTLEHLVSSTINRADATKFLYVLNQIDNTEREDNLEEVVAAWQRALAQHGLTAGRFYRIFARHSTLEGAEEPVRTRLQRIRDEDLADIEARIRQVEVERAYRIVGVLEKTARHIETVQLPLLAAARAHWRRSTFWLSSAVFAGLAILLGWWTISADYWQGLRFAPIADLSQTTQLLVAATITALVAVAYLQLRRLSAQWTLRKLLRDSSLGSDREAIICAFKHNAKAWWRSAGSKLPRGWGRRKQRQLNKVLAEADTFVQSLNDRYAHPSGEGMEFGRRGKKKARSEQPPDSAAAKGAATPAAEPAKDPAKAPGSEVTS